METISFLLGVGAVITSVVVAVTFMNYMAIKNLIKEVTNFEKAEQRLYEFSNEQDNAIRRDLEAVYRHVDSRVDKLEEKTKRELKDLTSTKSN
jgi:predicted PurR-regulated permease PerM